MFGLFTNRGSHPSGRVACRQVGWTFFYMFVVLKIPIIAAMYLVWWAIREQPEPTDEELRERISRDDDDRPRPRRPRPPRRGPHAEPEPQSPQRIRAHGTQVERTHG
jgi:hypothetical protein